MLIGHSNDQARLKWRVQDHLVATGMIAKCMSNGLSKNSCEKLIN